ncbi:MAG: ABC transporter substrate-binding protein [Pseudomonadota bacterium]
MKTTSTPEPLAARRGRTRRGALAAAAALAAALSFGPAKAVGVDEARTFVENVVEELRVLVENDRSGAAGAQEFLSLLEARASLNAVGRFAVGRSWRDMSSAQQAAYQKAFRAYISNTYQNRFTEYGGEDIVVTGARDAGKKGVLVTSVLKRPSAENVAVEWLVNDREGSTRLSDVLFEGVSLAITLRETFSGMIEKRGGDIDRFIADLESSRGA